MKHPTRQLKGIELALVAAIALTVGLMGYGIYSSGHSDTPEQTLQQIQDKHADTAVEVPTVPVVETAKDLDEIQQILDHVPLDAAHNDEKELEAQADF